MDEFSFIEYLRKKISANGRVSVGIGDDAAVLGVAKDKQLVVSTDVIVENVDFILRRKTGNSHFSSKNDCPHGSLSPEKIGRKALAINLSDMAAMGARPVAFVITIGKPRYISAAWLKRFYSGLLALAKQYNVACVGGDFSRSKEFFASVTIFGEVEKGKAVTRSGAKRGDWVAVTGVLGGSLMQHHHDFTPRVREGAFLAKNGYATSMIDISDGLVQDLSHILKASKAGAVLDLDKIPISSVAKKMSKGNCSEALKKALSEGEDFELLFTMTDRKKTILAKRWMKKFPRVPLTWIGRIAGKASQIKWQWEGKQISPPKLAQAGFLHF